MNQPTFVSQIFLINERPLFHVLLHTAAFGPQFYVCEKTIKYTDQRLSQAFPIPISV